MGPQLSPPVIALASLRTTAETLRKGYDGELTPTQQAEVESIERNSGYLQDTINCVGHMYELENKPIAGVQEVVDLLAEVVAPVLDRPEYLDNRKGIFSFIRRLISEYR